MLQGSRFRHRWVEGGRTAQARAMRLQRPSEAFGPPAFALLALLGTGHPSTVFADEVGAFRENTY